MSEGLISFTKMHGLGNDFMVLERITQSFELTHDLVKLLGDRHLGVGFDQLLLVEAPDRPDADFKYRIYNSDGSEVEQCGNGARCFARFVVERGLSFKRKLAVETACGLIYLTITDSGLVSVDMGHPEFALKSLPFVPLGAPDSEGRYVLSAGTDSAAFYMVSMGNPHAVTLVDDVLSAPVSRFGSQIVSHPTFPKQVNVGFMQIVNPSSIRLRVYERGAGETQACGTGACAAVVAGVRMGLLKSGKPVDVQLYGGRLQIEWSEGKPVIMTGPTERVFDGQLDLMRLRAMANAL